MDKEDIFKYQIRRNITSLYKGFLIMLEDVKYKHDKKMEQISEYLPKELDVIGLAEYLDDEDMQEYRKKILDSGNDCIRQIEESGKNCDVIKG